MLNLLNLDREAMERFCVELGEKPYRAQQLMKWIYHQQETDFTKMTTFNASLRAQLNERCEIKSPAIALDQTAIDGTRKWLLKLNCGNHVETVFIPERHRGTLCISSQVGCSLNCSFCATGAQGFNRDLSTAEIIGQLWLAKKALLAEIPPRRITNVVFMGMGEPLLNYDNVLRAIRMMLDDLGFGLSKYRVTVSSSGVVPELKRLSHDCKVALAISLHAPNDTLRNELVPLNKKYPLKELLGTCRDFFNDRGEHKRYITMEYVMLDSVNDQDHHAHELVRLLTDIRCKVNLIPFNPFPNTRYKRSPQARIDRFQKILMEADLITITRRTRGDDIDAACGQLAGDFKDRTKRRERLQKIGQGKVA